MIEIVRKILNVLPNSLSLFIFKLAIRIKNRKKVKANKQLLDKVIVNREINKEFYVNLKDYCIFGSHIGADLYIQSYFIGNGLKPINLNMPSVTTDKVIMICCVKNDLVRVKKVISHHRKIGITNMVFVDNMSDDGTREYLMNEFVDLYSVDEPYHAGRKSSWIRQIQDIYGYGRWYLVVDSDELFSYVGMEEHSILDLVRYAEKRNKPRIRSMLLDMYPNHKLYSKDDRGGEYDFTKDYRFFDYNSYHMAKDGRGYMVRGGPRKRCLEKGMDHSEPLTKYPLFYAKEEDIWDDHRPMPYFKNFQSLNISVLRHYKFMEGDLKKYEAIAEEGNYYNASANYKIYVSKGDGISFFTNESVEFDSSMALQKLEFLEKIEWGLI